MKIGFLFMNFNGREAVWINLNKQANSLIIEGLPNQKQIMISIFELFAIILQYIEGRMAASTSEEQQILHLNALSNVGSLEAIRLLQAKISEKNPKSIRVQAIYAFKNLGFQNQLKVLNHLYQLLVPSEHWVWAKNTKSLFGTSSYSTMVIPEANTELNITLPPDR